MTTAIPIESLEQEIVRLADDIGSRMARWLPLVAEFDRRDGARRWGFRGTAEWLAWRCGIGIRAARDHVRVARRLETLPLIGRAFGAGELSYSKVRALTRASEAEDEEALLNLARTSTAAQLERSVRSLRSAASADVDTINAAHAARFVEWWWEADGSLRISARLAGDDAAAFIEAVESAAEALHGVPGAVPDVAAAEAADEDPAAGDAPDAPPEPLPDAPPQPLPRRPSLGARRADALVEMAVSGAPRAQVVLHVDPAALACTATAAAERAGEVCALQDGPAVPSETARRLACDAEIVEAHRSAGGAVDYGRRRRVVPPPLRLSLERRDGGCRFPGCTRRHGLHAHHVHHWALGGRTDRDNLVLLCRFHHRLVHEDGFTVAGHGPEFRFRRPDGVPIADLPAAAAASPPMELAA